MPDLRYGDGRGLPPLSAPSRDETPAKLGTRPPPERSRMRGGVRWTLTDLERKGFVVQPEPGLAQVAAVSLILPWPTLLNRLYMPVTTKAGKARTILTPEGRQYKQDAVFAAREQHQGRAPLEGPLRLWMESHRPEGTRSDVDGLFKVVLDVLGKDGAWIYHDDDQIVDVRNQKLTPSTPGYIKTTITALTRLA